MGGRSLGTVKIIRSPAAGVAPEAGRLVSAGYRVNQQPITGPGDLRGLGRRPPRAVVIDLGRAPTRGRDLALAIRQQRSTRQLPVVFVDGDPDTVRGIRALLPASAHTTWGRVVGAVGRAVSRPRTSTGAPPSALAGYSGTPLPKKLGIREGASIVLVGAPPGFMGLLEPLGHAITVKTVNRGRRDVTLWFTRSRRELDRGMARMAAAISDSRLWIIWPKKTSPLAADHSELDVRRIGLASGLVDFKICAVDADWSGLAFVRRKTR